MEAKPLVLAVDGGGSASRAALYRHDGTPLREATVGPLSRKSSGEDAVAASLLELRDFLGEDACQLRCAALGLSGLDTTDDFEAMARLLAEAGLAALGARTRKHAFGRTLPTRQGHPMLLCSDAVLPLFGCGFEEGAVLVAGTGSVAVRIDAKGHVERFGGWGYRTSDEGSGCWVGCEFVREALHVADGLLAGSVRPGALGAASKTLLDEAYRAMRARSGAKSSANAASEKKARYLCDWAISHDDPKDYASLARTVMESRSRACRAIRARAAEHLARLAAAALSPGGATVVLSGGLFKNAGFAEQVSKAIAKQAEGTLLAVVNQASPTEGAFALAQRLWPVRPEVPRASNANVRSSMQGNKGSNTKPEMVVREHLRKAGLSGYRLHWKAPGRPDVAWPSKKVCILVNGCFWHRHEGCSKATMPKSNTEYWIAKFDRNVERDAENLRRLEADGWRVHVVWECELDPQRRDETMERLVGELRRELGKESRRP